MASLGLPLALDAACEIGRFNPVRCVSRISKQSFAHPFLRWFPANLGCRCSVAQSRPTLCDPRDCSTPGSLSFIISQSFCRLMIVEPVMPSNHLILCLPFSPWPSIFPSFRIFSNESILHIKWPKYWSLSFSISPSKEHPGLISFRMDWLDLLAVQGTLKSLLQHHRSKSSILRCSAFFTVQLSHDHW